MNITITWNTLIYLIKTMINLPKENKIVKFELLVSRRTKPNLKIKESSSRMLQEYNRIYTGYNNR